MESWGNKDEHFGEPLHSEVEEEILGICWSLLERFCDGGERTNSGENG